MMGILKGPWVDGPKELIQHGVDHLDLGGDFDRRIAMVSVDNAVELTIKTYLGLPERTRGSKGPGRKELEQAGESFPALLDLLETYASHLITGLSLERYRLVSPTSEPTVSFREWNHR